MRLHSWLGDLEMSIKVACFCGATFAAPDELAGKKVKCPKCGRSFVVPGAGTPSASAPATPAAAPAKAQAVRRCVQCNAAMSADAVLCVECGYDYRSGAGGAAQAAATEKGKAVRVELPVGWSAVRMGLDVLHVCSLAYALALLAVGLNLTAGLFALVLVTPARWVLGMVAFLFVVILPLGIKLYMDAPGAFAAFLASVFYIVALSYLLVVFPAIGGAVAAIVLVVAVVSLLLAGLAGGAGLCLCVAVPAKSQARGLAIASAGSLFASVACFLVAALIGAFRGAESPGSIGPMFVLGFLLAVAAHALFLFFLYRTAHFFEDEGTMSYVGTYLAFFGTVAAMAVFVSVLLASGLVTGFLRGLMQLFILVSAIVCFVWLIRVIGSVSDVIHERRLAWRDDRAASA
jgi:hypothetical protein